MKILHIPNYYYPHIGGIEQTARDCVRASAGENVERRVLCFNHDKGNITDEVDGVPVVRAGCFAKISSQSLSLSYKKLLKREFKEFAPDVVVFHYPNPFAAHYLLKRLKKAPGTKLILYWHLDITKQKILGKFFKGQNRKLLSRADRIVATSPNYIDGSPYLSAYREKCVVIPSCVAEERVRCSEKTLARAAELKEIFRGRTMLFALGRHVPYKGMEYLVRASKLLPNGYAICIGGEGPLTEELKKLAEDDPKVTFLGKMDEEERKAYLSACDVFCFPSVAKNEAFGIALAEAMMMGKPSVTFTVEGSGINFVSPGGVTGEQAENGNAEAFAQAIEKIVSDEALCARYGKAAKERAETLFSEEAYRDGIRKLFSAIES